MWSLQNGTATLEARNFRARLDLKRPQRGLHDWTWADHHLDGVALFELQLPGSTDSSEDRVVDRYIRGSDLVVTYAEEAPRTVRPQVYYRVALPQSSPDALVLDVEVSMQTSRLESEPATGIRSRWPARCSSRSTTAMTEFGMEPMEYGYFPPTSERGVAYAEVVHPSDRADGGPMVAGRGVDLFHHSLEKGVIRRARLRGILMPPSMAPGEEAELLQAFASAPPPLTT